jgi:hypothetical protein
MCALAALYDGDLELSTLRLELRPIPSPRMFDHLIAQPGALIDAYLIDVRTQVSRYEEKSKRARSSARARWERELGQAGRSHAIADANASAIAHAEKREKTRSPLSPRADQAPEFIRFWQAYPRKVAKARAAKAWQKLAPDQALVATMHEALAWQQEQPQWLKDEGAFIPHPASWLNGRRWEDDRPTTTSHTGDDGFDLLRRQGPSSTSGK